MRQFFEFSIALYRQTKATFQKLPALEHTCDVYQE